jgi:DNA repair exonuclease SbcCD ATPase subunit
LDLDGKNINAKIIYDEEKLWPMEMASGMEKFITGIAIRVALVGISNLPRPNFLAIDEGFSTLDADNSANLPMVFDYLKSQFDFIFLISHMDYIRDFVDISLDLKKDTEGFSKITFK